MKKKTKEELKKNRKWLITSFFITFMTSIIFGYASSELATNINTIFSVIVLILIIITNILLDIVATAVSVADEAPFHAKASDKKKGAKKSIMLLKNRNKVLSVCGDIVGDICGIISGSMCAFIAINIASQYEGLNLTILSLVTTALVASFTILGKALGKIISIENANSIINAIGVFLDLFSIKKKK